MVEISFIGIALHQTTKEPVLFLYAKGAQRVLRLPLAVEEAGNLADILPAEIEAGEGLRLEELLLPARHSAEQSHDAVKRAAALAREQIVRDTSQVMQDRPRTFDLMLQAIEVLGGRLAGVDLVSVAGGVYYADMLITTGQGIVRVDCRPSDGIALALRSKADLRCRKELLPFAEDLRPVLPSLPADLRARAESLLQSDLEQHHAELQEKNVRVQMPSVIRAALAAKAMELTRQKNVLSALTDAVEIKESEPELVVDAEAGCSQAHLAQPREGGTLFGALPEGASVIPAEFLADKEAAQDACMKYLSEESRFSALLHFLLPETEERM